MTPHSSGQQKKRNAVLLRKTKREHSHVSGMTQMNRGGVVSNAKIHRRNIEKDGGAEKGIELRREMNEDE